MRYELTDYEWAAIKPMLPNKSRDVPRVNDRRVLNGIFWVLRSGAPWRDLPESFGPYTTCYNRFVRWRRAGVWGGIMNALAATHDVGTRLGWDGDDGPFFFSCPGRSAARVLQDGAHPTLHGVVFAILCPGPAVHRP
jgi:transposase